jgi:uncharacterized protein (TIGR00369 family)
MRNNIPKTQPELEASALEFIEILNHARPGTIQSKMHVSFVSCDFESRTITVSYETMPWMSNPIGVMHGGIIGAVLDSAMGALVFALSGRKFPPTVSLQISYLRPIPLGSRIMARARADFIGRTNSSAAAELWMENQPDKLMATASGIFYTGGKPEPDQAVLPRC